MLSRLAVVGVSGGGEVRSALVAVTGTALREPAGYDVGICDEDDRQVRWIGMGVDASREFQVQAVGALDYQAGGQVPVTEHPVAAGGRHHFGRQHADRAGGRLRGAVRRQASLGRRGGKVLDGGGLPDTAGSVDADQQSISASRHGLPLVRCESRGQNRRSGGRAVGLVVRAPSGSGPLSRPVARWTNNRAVTSAS